MDPVSNLTPRDIAADLSLTLDTVGDYLRAGRIPGAWRLHDGGPWRIDAEVYAAWKAEQMAAADPNRIAPRSSRSRAAQERRRAS